MYVVSEKEESFSPQRIWQALSDPVRRGLLDKLAAGPLATKDLCAGSHLSRFGIMKHLGVLEAAGLVIARRQGRLRVNHINAAPLHALQARWLNPQTLRLASLSTGIDRLIQEETLAPTNESADQTDRRAGVAEAALDWTVQAPIQRVWRLLVEEVEAWWPVEHRAAGEGSIFSLEPELGGRLEERDPAGNGILWYTVIALSPQRSIDLSGNLAARYGGPATSLLHIELEPATTEGATVLKLTDSVFGRIGPNLTASLASGWEAIIGAGFKAYAEQALS